MQLHPVLRLPLSAIPPRTSPSQSIAHRHYDRLARIIAMRIERSCTPTSESESKGTLYPLMSSILDRPMKNCVLPSVQIYYTRMYDYALINIYETYLRPPKKINAINIFSFSLHLKYRFVRSKYFFYRDNSVFNISSLFNMTLQKKLLQFYSVILMWWTRRKTREYALREGILRKRAVAKKPGEAWR